MLFLLHLRNVPLHDFRQDRPAVVDHVVSRPGQDLPGACGGITCRPLEARRGVRHGLKGKRADLCLKRGIGRECVVKPLQRSDILAVGDGAQLRAQIGKIGHTRLDFVVECRHLRLARDNEHLELRGGKAVELGLHLGRQAHLFGRYIDNVMERFVETPETHDRVCRDGREAEQDGCKGTDELGLDGHGNVLLVSGGLLLCG